VDRWRHRLHALEPGALPGLVPPVSGSALSPRALPTSPVGVDLAIMRSARRDPAEIFGAGFGLTVSVPRRTPS
jgi:hypothetical protein